VSDRYKEMWEDAFHDNLEKKAEISELKAENARLKAEVERLTQLNDTLALRYDATKSMLDGCAKEIEEMEAEVERLTSDLQMEKENEDRLVRLHQDARNEVERLTKAGDAVCESPYLWETDPAVIEWRAAKEGKQS
jgi:predicted RNase H-like nuclease (RuvC/YqgF family)